MTLSPEERLRVFQLVAEKLVDEFKQAYPDLDAVRVLPLKMAAQLLGMTPRQVRASFSCVRIGGRYGVTMRTIKDHIAAHTVPPTTQAPPVTTSPAPAGT